eukprot:TRINITY_DN9397_c0_g1_i1.p1 TRINITY_DN9397_c0_g1~~TRINITY_DN9397_c0_g1_i1.p1  ORF type:complete len:806 (+),score=90.46 TRINITY_DN9397_c0_g1_i1:37-2454(+)
MQPDTKRTEPDAKRQRTEQCVIVDEDEDEANLEEAIPVSVMLPSYYLANFRDLQREATDLYRNLFTDEELALLSLFPDLPETAQRLFVRLWNRKGPWFRLGSLAYPEAEIGDRYDTVHTLHQTGFAEQFCSCVFAGSQAGTWVCTCRPHQLSPPKDITVSYREGPAIIEQLLALLPVAELKDVLAKTNPSLAVRLQLSRAPRRRYVEALRQGMPFTGTMEPVSGRASPVNRLQQNAPVRRKHGSQPQPSQQSQSQSQSQSPQLRQSSIASFVTRSASRLHTPSSELTQATQPASPTGAARAATEILLQLGACLRLSAIALRVFQAAERLHYLDWESVLDSSGGTQSSARQLLVSLHLVKFPRYQVRRTVALFPDRAHLEAYRDAVSRRDEFLRLARRDAQFATLRPRAHDMEELLRIIQEELIPTLSERRCLSLPQLLLESESAAFLYRFTEECVLLRTLADGIELLESRRQYDDAVMAIRLLLDFPLYRPQKRGHWWNRMATDLEHEGRKNEALEICESAVKSEREIIRRSDLICIERRLQRLHTPPRRWKTLNTEGWLSTNLLPYPKIQLRGIRIPVPFDPRGKQSGGKSQWEHPLDKQPCSVESLVLGHYNKEGWEGHHCEGGILRAVFALLMWDVIFDDTIDHVFQTPYQNAPLDIGTAHFFATRKEKALARLEEIKKCSRQELCEKLEDSWRQHNGEACLGVSWQEERERGSCTTMSALSAFVSSIAPSSLATILEDCTRFYNMSGFPDLVMWRHNPEGQPEIKVIEVKGPGDKLSEKQLVWLDVLMRAGVDACVCHVST